MNRISSHTRIRLRLAPALRRFTCRHFQ